MGKEKLKKVIKFIADNLRGNGIKVSKIVVFGSQITNNTNRNSDIDLIIVSDDFKNKDIIKRGRMTMDAEIQAIRKFRIPFDVLKMTKKEYNGGNTFMAEVAKEEGKVFYASH